MNDWSSDDEPSKNSITNIIATPIPAYAIGLFSAETFNRAIKSAI